MLSLSGLQRVTRPCIALSLLCAIGGAFAAVTLDDGTFTPTTGTGGTSQYLAIPYALPPVGNLRYRLPQANAPYSGNYAATSFGPACYQQSVNITGSGDVVGDLVNALAGMGFNEDVPQSEDCLTLNVWTPPNVAAGANLPVVYWIYGGGFSIGSTSQYDGGAIVAHSVSLGTPIIYVSINYRLSGLGFLAGNDVQSQQIGNLGLQDQRLGMRWVQKYISSFGGDPDKVTIWGQSAGAMSVSMHLIANNGNNEGLFRAAYMQSGGVLPVGTLSDGQAAYEALLQGVGCKSASDGLACLRTVPYAQLTSYFDTTPAMFSYSSLHLTWTVKADGVFINDLPQQMILDGKVAPVPFVTGDVLDEGTAFAVGQTNDTTEADFISYIKAQYFPTATDAEISSILAAYPSTPSDGAPYNTGSLNAITPMFKRFASFVGDLVFQSPRRFLLQNRYSHQPAWSYLYTRGQYTPLLGAMHSSDIDDYYSTTSTDAATYLVTFVNTMTLPWPQWTDSSRSMLSFGNTLLGGDSIGNTTDTYREAGITLLQQLSLKYTPL